MPKIIIERPYEWNNQRKKIEVYIDNTKVGHVGIDDTQQFEVAAGQHTLMLKNPWPSRNTIIDVDVNDNQNKTIKMSTSKYNPWIMFGSATLLLAIINIIKYFSNIELFWTVEISAFVSIFIISMFVISKIELLKLEELD